MTIDDIEQNEYKKLCTARRFREIKEVRKIIFYERLNIFLIKNCFEGHSKEIDDLKSQLIIMLIIYYILRISNLFSGAQKDLMANMPGKTEVDPEEEKRQQEQLQAMDEAEKDRKSKWQKQENQREGMRQGIRDKVRLFVFT